MNIVGFPEQNCILAKDQPEYEPLPVCIKGDAVISCWKLSLRERIICLLTGRIWVLQLAFKQPLQPQLLTVDKDIAFEIGQEHEG